MAEGVRLDDLAQASMSRIPTAGGVPRPALLRALDGIRATRLGLVVAWPGTGKTTLMARWARGQGGLVAWCRLTLADADPRALIRTLEVAVRSAGMTGAPQSSALAGPEPGPVAGPANRAGEGASGHLVTEPANAHDVLHLVDLLPAPLLLVLDDVHHIVGTPAEAELETLILGTGDRLRILLGSRSMPTLNLTRSEIPPPVVLSGRDLRFRIWDTDALMRSAGDEPLPLDDLVVITRETEGWAAAVRLFQRSIEGRLPAERRRAVHALAMHADYAAGYLDATVLRGLPAHQRDFLSDVAVFENLSAARVDAHRGTSTGHEDLRAMARSVPLLIDVGNGRFRMHRVLRRHLISAARAELGPVRTSAWFAGAAAILRTEGATHEALRALCLAEDWRHLTDLLEEIGPGSVDIQGRLWTDPLPVDRIGPPPWRTIARARAAHLEGRFDRVRNLLNDLSDSTSPAERAATRLISAGAGVWSTVPARDRSDGWEHCVREASRRDPLQAARRAARQRGPGAALAEGISLLIAGDQRTATEVLHRCASDPEAPDEMALAARLVEVSMASTRPTLPTLAAIDRVYVAAEQAGHTWLARLAHGAIVSFDGDERSHRRAQQLTRHCDGIGDAWGAAIIAWSLALSCLRAGGVHPQEWDDLGLRFRTLGATSLEAWARSLYALTATAARLPDAAADAMAAESFARTLAVPGALAVAYATLARSAGADSAHAAEMMHLATSTAEAEGLLARPWEWLSPAAVEAYPTEDAKSRLRHAAEPAPSVGAPGVGASAGPPDRSAPPSHVVAELDVRCFGAFSITVRGRAVDLGQMRPRARAVLRILALSAGRPVHRERLAEALWRDLDPAAAMHNLQVSVSTIRRCLEPGRPARSSTLLVRDGEAYALHLRSSSRCDVVEFEAALRTANKTRRTDPAAQAAALRRALDLYADDLLPEDGPAEWVTGPRDRYRSQAAEAAATLGALELAAGNLEAAVSAANRSIELNTFRDASWQLLIDALHRSGAAAEAQRAQRDYARMLATLGVPAGTTRVLGTLPLPVPRTTPG
ncbi:BTAD domain-containing putative transcriptional regulator [Occultella gossypii]|uniref:Winged helix-turn-helix domain-containing protein n=1 Tax=Occultella gossypii TaxID=2800820 RepID=A0ABS7S9N2_9MICO|nr:BTAD domain-containing putative transcriptional regulator [Occultella gossypii]MBZ2197054.1 winged helix-turn-helix domain-containing protein [Occultella gossypii]